MLHTLSLTLQVVLHQGGLELLAELLEGLFVQQLIPFQFYPQGNILNNAGKGKGRERGRERDGRGEGRERGRWEGKGGRGEARGRGLSVQGEAEKLLTFAFSVFQKLCLPISFRLLFLPSFPPHWAGRSPPLHSCIFPTVLRRDRSWS